MEAEIVGLGRGAAVLGNTHIFSEHWFVAYTHAESAGALRRGGWCGALFGLGVPVPFVSLFNSYDFPTNL